MQTQWHTVKASQMPFAEALFDVLRVVSTALTALEFVQYMRFHSHRASHLSVDWLQGRPKGVAIQERHTRVYMLQDGGQRRLMKGQVAVQPKNFLTRPSPQGGPGVPGATLSQLKHTSGVVCIVPFARDSVACHS